MGKSSPQGRAFALIAFVPNKFDAWFILGKRLKFFPGPVSRAIIYDDQLLDGVLRQNDFNMQSSFGLPLKTDAATERQGSICALVLISAGTGIENNSLPKADKKFGFIQQNHKKHFVCLV